MSIRRRALASLERLLPQRAVSRTFLRTSALVAAGHFLILLIGIASLRVFTELAPRETYGAANLALTALALAMQLVVAPVVNVEIRYMTEAARAGRADAFAGQALRWALAAAAALSVAVGAVILGMATAGRPIAGITVASAAGWILASTLRNVVISRLQAEQRMAAYMLGRVAEAALIAVAVAGALAWIGGPEGFVLGQVAALGLVAAGLCLLAPWPTLRLLTKRETSEGFGEKIWRYGAPFVPMAALIWLANLGDRYVLAGLAGTAEAGQYVAVFAIGSAGFGLAGGLMGDLFRPRLFDAENAGDRAQAARIFTAWMVTCGLIVGGGLLALAILGNWIASLVLAESYRAGALPIMLWIAAGYAIRGLSIVCENRILSLGRSGRLVSPLAVGAVANVVLAILLVPANGAVGAAQANFASFALQFAATLLVMQRLLAERRATEEGAAAAQAGHAAESSGAP